MYHVGQKVRMASIEQFRLNPEVVNCDGFMDRYANTIMTIKEVGVNDFLEGMPTYKMEEDQNDENCWRDGWYWFDCLIDGPVGAPNVSVGDVLDFLK